MYTNQKASNRCENNFFAKKSTKRTVYTVRPVDRNKHLNYSVTCHIWKDHSTDLSDSAIFILSSLTDMTLLTRKLNTNVNTILYT